jgi:signal transduction histidine kinase
VFALRWHRLPPALVDAVFAVAVAAFVVSTAIGERRHQENIPTVGLWLMAGMAPALAVRRRFPGTCLAVVAAIQIGLFATGTAASANVLAELIAPYSAAAYSGRRVRQVCGVGAAVAIVGIAFAWWASAEGRLSALGVMIAGGVAWTVGAVIRVRRERTVRLAGRAAMLENERETLTRQAVADERLHIARELHDVVAHHLTVVVVQSQALQAVLDGDPVQVRTLAGSIEETGREALSEMRNLLTVLRADDGTGGASAPGSPPDPPPSLDRLPALVEQVRQAGITVQLRMADAGPVPQAVQVSAYRIAQEALTNVIKHAGPAAVTVSVAIDDGEMELVVTDDGRGAAAGLSRTGSASVGHGLVGMRERVGVFGGSVTAGPRAGGGYEVRAKIPISRSPS